MIHLYASLLFFLAYWAHCQSPASCALSCIADVAGTNCNQAQWSCLCRVEPYLQRLSTCARLSCNTGDYDTAISAVKQICAVFDASLTIQPYATASTFSSEAVFSTVALPSISSLSPNSNNSITSVIATSSGLSTTAASLPGTSASASASGSSHTTVTSISTLVVTAGIDATNWPIPAHNFTLKPTLQFSNTVRATRFTIHNSLQVTRENEPAAIRPVDNVELATSQLPRFHESATATAQPVTATALRVETATTTPANSPHARLQRPQPAYRRSFLETFLARQQNRDRHLSRQHNSSRVLNPINHIPRPTPIRIPPIEKPVKEEEEETGLESKTLLTLPEQRRSRQNSPHTPTVEQSPRLDPGSARSRSSIGLPSNQQRGSYPVSMSGQELTKRESETHEPEKARARDDVQEPAPGRYNDDTYDIESQSTNIQGAAFPGVTYGFHPSDHPTQPPRRVESISSARRAQSMTSLRTDNAAPPEDQDFTQNPEVHPDESVAEELAWNSAHPCFPHPNPHVPLSSPYYEQTRVIRIKRDWMAHGDLAPAYSNIYPEILDPLLPESEFRFLINHINRTLLEAFDPFSAWNWIDCLLGLATGWLWEDFRPGGMKRKLRGLEFWIDQWNQRVGSRDGVRVIPLRRTGYMSLDIEIPDPQVRVVDPNEEPDEQYIPDDESNMPAQPQMTVRDIRRGTTVTTDTESRM